MLRQWIDLVRSVGAALLEVYRAEAEELKTEVRDSTVQLAWAIGLFVAAGMLGFWAIFAAIYCAIQVLAIWLPLWGAAGVVLGVLVLVILILAFLGLRRLKRWENPAETIKRRLSEHRVWLEQKLLPAEEGEEGEEAAAEREMEQDEETDR